MTDPGIRLMVKLRRKLIVPCGHAVLLSILLCRMLSAQSGATAALSGAIADSSGALVPGASVTLTFAQSGAERKVMTGPEGAFTFLQLSAGEYQMTVDAAGFRSIAQRVIYEGAPIHLNLVLSAAATHTEVIVTATNADPTDPAHVNITPEQIDRMPTESVSSPLSSLVTMTTPGAAADSNGSFHPLGDHRRGIVRD